MHTAQAIRPHSIRYEDWKGPIQMAMDLDQLVAIVRAYLAEWPFEDLRLLPEQVSATALPNSEAIVARAVMASQAELMWRGDEAAYKLVREMALTLGAASARLRHLHAMRTTF
jgi:hypothetical protein